MHLHRVRPDRYLVALFATLTLAACTSSSSPAGPSLNDIPDPVFTDPLVKIALTGATDTFSRTLYDQYVYQDTDLVDTAKHPDIYMTYFGGANGRGRALAFIDSTNYFGTSSTPTAKAIWILGTGNWQYAAYRLANESERWYERYAMEKDGQLKLHGNTYTDPFPVTRAQNDKIWENYSLAYASMAKLFKGNGRTVRARFFVWYDTGTTKLWAGATSTVWAECRKVMELVASGDVADMKCANVNFPDHRVPGLPDWTDCPSTCAPP